MRQQFRAADVVDTLERASREIGYPKTIRLDNGPEFISKGARPVSLHALCQARLQPAQQADRQCPNGKFRAECLNANWFLSLDEGTAKMRRLA
jgi:putative transposase